MLLGVTGGIAGGFVHFRMIEAKAVEERQWEIIRQAQQDIAVLQHQQINERGDPDADDD